MTPQQAGKLTDSKRWFRFWMPYAFVRLSHQRLKHVYLPLNRNYKPLGYIRREKVDYQAYLGQALSFRRDPLLLKGVWTGTSPHLYLYEDNPISRLTYFTRYERVMLEAELVEGLDQSFSDEDGWGPQGIESE